MKTACAGSLKFARLLPIMLAAWWCVSCGGGEDAGAPASSTQQTDQPPGAPPPLSPAQQTAEQNPPWIDSTKTYYGIVARQSASGNPVVDSIECGHAIRKAFMTGVVQQ
jgi:hypothetical protein